MSTWFDAIVIKKPKIGRHGKRVRINGVTYISKTEAMKKLGVGWTNLHRLMNRQAPTQAGRKKKPIIVDGVHYPSLRAAQSATGKSYYSVQNLKTPKAIKALRPSGAPMRFEVLYNGVEYSSLRAAAVANDVCMETIRRHGTVLRMIPIDSNLPQLR